MTRTSILEALSAPLCDAVVGRRGSSRCPAAARTVDPADRRLRRVVSLPFPAAGLPANASSRPREPERLAALHLRAAAWDRGERCDRAGHRSRVRGGRAPRPRRHPRGRGHGIAYHWSGRRATIRAWAHDPAPTRSPKRARGSRSLPPGRRSRREMPPRRCALRISPTAGGFEGRPPDGTSSFEAGRAMLRSAMARQGAF